MTQFPFDAQRSIDLISMGRVAVDLYSEQIHSPLSDVQTFRSYLGGCAGNIAVGTSRLGLQSSMFSYVGTDDMGQFLLKTLKREGVNTHLLKQTPKHLTGLVILGVDPPDSFPLIFYRENCADMQIQPEDCDENFFKQAKAILITGTGISTQSMRNTTHHALALASRCQMAVIIDLDYRPVLWNLTEKGEGESRYQASEFVTKHYQKVLPKCHLVVGTEEEVLIAGGGNDINQALINIRKLTNAPIVLKTGEKGCKILTTDFNQPIIGKHFPVKVLNVLGAGDAFMSGLLRGWLRQLPWETSATFANACGAIVVSRHGCAPAIPIFEELDYFINNYGKEKNILSSETLNRLHQNAILGTYDREEILILAYDHRWQFEKSAKNAGKNTACIQEFKQRVFDGFCQVKNAFMNSNLAILVDPQYGEHILKKATENGITVGVPIEAAGKSPLSWISSKPLYEEILIRPKQWFVKVLWQYHPDMETNLKELQISKLIELNKVCVVLERKLMIELIMPEAYDQTADAMQKAIQAVYDKKIYPYWWKIAAFNTETEWKGVCAMIRHYDTRVKIIILGGASKQIEDYSKQFALAKATGMCSGFAIGRSIFWEIWMAFIQDKIKIEAVAEGIAQKFTQVIKIWEKT